MWCLSNLKGNSNKDASFFKELVENVLDVLIAVELDGTVSYANSQIYQLLGYNVEEFTGGNFFRYIHPEDYPKLSKERKTKVKSNLPYTIEYRLQHKQGHYVPVYGRGVAFHAEGVTKFVAIIYDISKRKKNEEDLKKLHLLEEKSSLITENARDLITIINDKLKIDYVNSRAHHNILGYSETELLGLNIFDIIHPEDKELILKDFIRGSETGLGSSILRLKHKDGSYVWVETNGTVIQDVDGKNKSLVISRDISEKMQVEQKLRNSEKRLFDILNTAPLGIMEIHVQPRAYKPFVNKKFLEIMEVKAEKVETKFQEEFIKKIHPDDVNTFLNKTLEKSIFRLLSKNNTIKWIERTSNVKLHKGRVTDIRIWLQDITEKMEAELKVMESERKYRFIFENSPLAICLMSFDGRIVDCNSSLEQFLGLRKETMIGKDFRKVFKIPSEFLMLVVESFKKCLKKETPEPNEIQFITKDGVLKWSYLHASIINFSNKDFIQVIGQDITEQKQMASKIKKNREKFTAKLQEEVLLRTKELEQALELQEHYLAQLNEASNFKSQFLTKMSHELRTPLNIIIGFSDLLMEKSYGELNEQQLNFLNDIGSSALHLLDLINDILDISKIEAGKVELNIEKFEVTGILNQLISSLKPLCDNKGLEMIVNGLNKEIKMTADKRRFKEIAYNLLSNAIKYTESGTIQVNFFETKYDWKFEVIDTGIGIAREDFNLIFKNFERLDNELVRNTEGTGLGLALTKKLVELHRGKIWFESELGKGSTFAFTLPKTLK